MRGSLTRAVFAVGAIALVGAASAYAITFELDKTTISATADIAPRELPAQGNAPVAISSVTRVTTADGSSPPALRELVFLLDKNGVLDTKGLPVCPAAKLADTTPAVARKRCAGAIVGVGTGRAKVSLPGKAAVEISSPLTLFNAPRIDGKPALIAHAYETLPVAKTLLIPFPIERVSHGRYGYQARIPIPAIAEGFGAATLAEATVGKTWKRGGKTVGYTSAHCNGGRLQVYGTASFTDGSFFPVVLASPCHSRG
jgi:hypothetical protein